MFLRDIQCVNRDTGDTFDRTPPGTDVIGIIIFLLYTSLAVFAMLLFTDYFKRQIFSIFPFILSLPAGAAAENVSPAVSDSTAKSDKYNSDRTMSYCRQWRKQESVLPLHSHIFQKVLRFRHGNNKQVENGFCIFRMCLHSNTGIFDFPDIFPADFLTALCPFFQVFQTDA